MTFDVASYDAINRLRRQQGVTDRQTDAFAIAKTEHMHSMLLC